MTFGMRIVSPSEAVAGIRSGEQIFLQGAAATPSVLLDALVARAAELEDVRVLHLHCEGPGPHLSPAMAGHFRHRSLWRFIPCSACARSPDSRCTACHGRGVTAMPAQ